MFFKRSNYRMPTIHSATSDEKGVQNANPVFGFSVSVISDAGCVRSQNEDNFLVLDQINEMCESNCQQSLIDQGATKGWLLAGVFDGISSTEKAEMASREAAAAFRKSGCVLKKDSSDDKANMILRSTFLNINDQIVKLKQGSTTATVLCTNKQFFKIFHLGDSRAYLFRDGQLHQLTRDQTLAQLKLDAGLYNSYSPDIGMESHVLTDYMGRNQGGYPAESDWIPIQDRDQIVLCSDGLYELCSNKEMVQILQEETCTDNQAQKMVEVAKKKGGPDNVTCIVVRFFNTEKGCELNERI